MKKQYLELEKQLHYFSFSTFIKVKEIYDYIFSITIRRGLRPREGCFRLVPLAILCDQPLPLG